jgi:hypothetical protein
MEQRVAVGSFSNVHDGHVPGFAGAGGGTASGIHAHFLFRCSARYCRFNIFVHLAHWWFMCLQLLRWSRSCSHRMGSAQSASVHRSHVTERTRHAVSTSAGAVRCVA